MASEMTDGSSALQPQSGVTSPRLVSLAILKASWNQGRSYLDNFVPFVAECLRTSQGPVTVKEMRTALRVGFGMHIPEGTVSTILRGAVRDGLAERRDGVYVPAVEALAKKPIAALQSDLLRCYEALVAQLQTFASLRYGRNFTAAQASAVLDSYVSDYGTSIVMQGQAAKREFLPSVVAEPGADFIIHAFVEHIVSADPASFDYLTKVVEGSMLASVVYLPDTGAVDRKFRDSTIYLDTPFLLRALGHLGDQPAAPAIELIDLLKTYKARVACFDKTFTELRGVLLAAGNNLGSRSGRAPTDVVATFMQRNMRKADVELLVADLAGALKRLGVGVLPTPRYSISLGVDEVAFEAVLDEEVRYQNENARRHDLDALTAINRLRDGRAQPILEDSKAILLTTNEALVRASNRFFSDEGRNGNWPHAILDVDLTTLVWLKKPMGAPDLPRKQIMADCYATLRPGPAIWNEWLDEIQRIEAAGDYTDAQLDVMRYHPDAQRALMDRTLGDPVAITPETAGDVLRAAEDKIFGGMRDELQSSQTELVEEKARRVEAEAEAKAQAEARALGEADAAEQSRVRVAAAEERLSSDWARLAKLDERAGRRARKIGFVIFTLLVVLIAAGLLLAAVGVVVPALEAPVWLRLILWSAVGLAALAALAGAGWGVSAKSFTRRVESWLRPKLLRRYLRGSGDLA